MNENMFDGKAVVYDEARPEYPEECMDFLFSPDGGGLRANDAIADIGSGTGKLTALLVGRGCKVFAVEPNK
ncbi:MAG: SAM-dependent methyltransferase, partial [Clostridiales bacterium]|nr:SAM-dependent methyltransferase [Clostridiales bacterium]